MSRYNPKVGFVFSTKDRPEFSRRSLASIDSCGGFDLIWVDGSDTPEGKALPSSVKLHNCRLVEVHSNVKGGPDNAIRFGLKRLLSLGYEYCGLIENDIVLEPGWFQRLMELFSMASDDGFVVGAATVRNLSSRVLFYGPNYTINWVTGAGMVLFSRRAAKIVLATYGRMTARRIANFYKKKFGKDLSDVWELWIDKDDWLHGCDWAYSLQLYAHGMISVGSIPSMARNIDMDVEEILRTSYVSAASRSGNYEPPAFDLSLSPSAIFRLWLCDERLPLEVFFLLAELRMRMIEIPKRVKRMIPQRVKGAIKQALRSIKA